MHNSPIGILNSGVGGLSVWQEVTRLLPHESTIYLADSLHCPYGSKSPGEILQLSRGLVKKLMEKQVKLIVIACNTITVSALDALRKEFPSTPMIGTVPVVKTAAERSKKHKIGILSTKRTAGSEYQAHLIQHFASPCEVISVGTDRLVPLVERGEVNSPELVQILQEELQPFIQAKVDVVALGCTHFPFLREEIQQLLGPEVLLLDSGAAIARQVQRVLENNKIVSSDVNASHTFMTTGRLGEFERVVKRLLPTLSSRVSFAV